MLSSSYWISNSSIAVGVSARFLAPIGEGALRHLHSLGNTKFACRLRSFLQPFYKIQHPAASNLSRHLLNMGRAAASRTVASRVSSTAVVKRKRAVKKELTPTPAKSSRKQTKASSAAGSNPTDDLDNANPSKKTKNPKRKKAEESTSERRARRFRKEPPKSFRERLERAVTQR
jgi:hypothetical protein